MRWVAIKTKAGKVDEYAVGFVTHTVSKALIDEKPLFQAWRLTGAEAGQACELGVFETATEAKKACERDVLGMVTATVEQDAA